jgi:hypothetical protein
LHRVSMVEGKFGPPKLIHSLVRHRHARREHRDRRLRAFRLPTPWTPFFPAPGSKSTNTPQNCTDRSPLLGTAFRSPATAAPLSASIPGSKFLACPFGS